MLDALFLTLALQAVPVDDAVAAARRVYADVNARAASLRLATAKSKGPGVSYLSELRVWSEGPEVRKIEATDRDDSGHVVREYYYEGGRLLFVYEAVQGFEESGRAVTRVEQRYYFHEGRLVRWLGGVEKAPVPEDAEFAEVGASLRATSEAHLAAARKAAGAKRP